MNKDAPQSSRRDFLNGMLAVSALGCTAATAYPLLNYLKPPEITSNANEVELTPDKIAELKEKQATIVKLGAQAVLVLRDTNGDFRAVAATCTHLDCIVQYVPDDNTVWCACHNGVYDVQGRNISGPPPKPLEVFQVVASQGLDGKITIRRAQA